MKFKNFFEKNCLLSIISEDEIIKNNKTVINKITSLN